MSVDTCLEGKKGLANYRKLHFDDIEVLLAPAISGQAAAVELRVGKFMLFWAHLRADACPRKDHFLGPT